MASNRPFIVRQKRQDRLARIFIKTGGVAVILSVAAILFLIFQVTFPLYKKPRASMTSLPPVAETAEKDAILALGTDEYLETGYAFTRAGDLVFFGLAPGRPVERLPAAPEGGAAAGGLKAVDLLDAGRAVLLWGNGVVTLVRVKFTPQFGEGEDGGRTIQTGIEQLAAKEALPAGAEALRATARMTDGGAAFATLLADNRVALSREVRKENLFGDVTSEREDAVLNLELPGRATAIAMTQNGATLFVGTDTGELAEYDLAAAAGPRLAEVTPAFRDRGVTALGLVFGSMSLAVGDSKGGLSTWMKVREGSAEEKKLRRIHTMEDHPAAVTAIVPSARDKSLASLDREGGLHIDHMTSERHLFTLTLPAGIQAFGLAPRNNGLLGLGRDGSLAVFQLDNPHPEVSLKTLFGKVWYEGYDAPAYVWQSSAASDDFEPKISIVPLLFGTLKGTFYAMFFAVPLAIFGAVYVSQFANPRFRQTIKPTVEIMASLPSVVIGFLLALWLAPLAERWLVSIFLFFAILPVFFVIFMASWRAGYRWDAIRFFPKGYEFLLFTPVILLAAAAAWALGPPLERALFGDFTLWLYQHLGVRYDMRNCIIIAFGLGFCVIPIIFSIAEDSLSNIPFNLTAASLALGASRWQTVWRVIVPSASPGIFAGAMIGFGRAVGETMVVLMATGNTPILDWSIFNGMRTLSANIAVEIPEAPLGGTLYRVLFLCAVILFVLTFTLNTGAELVREHLRRKYMRY